MASSEEKRELFKRPLKKAPTCDKAVASKSNVHFIQPQSQDQRVTVFDSSITFEPFLDSVGLENLRKRQQVDAKAETSGTKG
ncbi:hypothetical protein PV04_02144 [Phialophora macrospora]|uniref:Uncharacterized protein n=1 Tax=Phialophora macrospora TaxID=1851006 RepID=A0A0D2E643_9EURO|nr:hypothetical protein PV04_02144 [Phialophora macrospora]